MTACVNRTRQRDSRLGAVHGAWLLPTCHSFPHCLGAVDGTDIVLAARLELDGLPFYKISVSSYVAAAAGTGAKLRQQ
jgi:hypothetical protein